MHPSVRTPSSTHRTSGATARAVALALGGRFADEFLGGMPLVVLPSIRDALGLGYAAIAAFLLVRDIAAAIVDPVAGLLIDAADRRWLLAAGAAGTALSVALIGVAPAAAVLLAGFAVFGAASGPLAHTADAVLVDAHPGAAGRVFARATALDTVGALLAPALVAAAVAAHLPWRVPLIAGAAAGAAYAVALATTAFPPPARAARAAAAHLRAELTANARAVATSRGAVGWLAVLFAIDVVEAPFALRTVWLADVAGMGQGLVAVYEAVWMLAMLAGVLWLERRLARAAPGRVLREAAVAMVVLLPAWMVVPGVASRFVLGVPLAFAFALPWPIARAQLLAAVPGRAGTASAAASLLGLAPLTLGVGLLAQAIGLTHAMLVVHMAGLVALTLLAWRMRGEQRA